MSEADSTAARSILDESDHVEWRVLNDLLDQLGSSAVTDDVAGVREELDSMLAAISDPEAVIQELKSLCAADAPLSKAQEVRMTRLALTTLVWGYCPREIKEKWMDIRKSLGQIPLDA
jgi:hypothetical protein